MLSSLKKSFGISSINEERATQKQEIISTILSDHEEGKYTPPETVILISEHFSEFLLYKHGLNVNDHEYTQLRLWTAAVLLLDQMDILNEEFPPTENDMYFGNFVFNTAKGVKDFYRKMPKVFKSDCYEILMGIIDQLVSKQQVTNNNHHYEIRLTHLLSVLKANLAYQSANKHVDFGRLYSDLSDLLERNRTSTKQRLGKGERSLALIPIKWSV